MRKTLSALGVAMILGSAQTLAVTPDDFHVKTTRDLVKLCKVDPDAELYSAARAFCLGYVDGAVDYHDVLTAHEDMKPLVCYPETATLELGASVFIAWGKERDLDDPIMGTPPVQGVIRALAEKWPCS